MIAVRLVAFKEVIMKEWFERFKEWVRNEPVRAAEVLRNLLFSLTAILAVAGVQVEATAISGAVTALISIYATQTVREKVTPVRKVQAANKYLSETKVQEFEDALNGVEDTV